MQFIAIHERCPHMQSNRQREKQRQSRGGTLRVRKTQISGMLIFAVPLSYNAEHVHVVYQTTAIAILTTHTR